MGAGWGGSCSRICISNTFPGVAVDAGLRTTLSEPRGSKTASTFFFAHEMDNLRIGAHLGHPLRLEDHMPGCSSESPVEFLVVFHSDTWLSYHPTANRVSTYAFAKMALKFLIMRNGNS